MKQKDRDLLHKLYREFNIEAADTADADENRIALSTPAFRDQEAEEG